MRTRVEDRDEDEPRGAPAGTLVLWLALAAFVAMMIIGVATLLKLEPTLGNQIWQTPEVQPRVAGG